MEEGLIRLQREELAELKVVKCNPVGYELRCVEGWGVSQLGVGHLGWTAFLQQNRTAYLNVKNSDVLGYYALLNI